MFEKFKALLSEVFEKMLEKLKVLLSEVFEKLKRALLDFIGVFTNQQVSKIGKIEILLPE